MFEEQNTQFDSVEAFQSCVMRLFYRSLLQVMICECFPAEFDSIRVIRSRSDPLEFPVGKLPFHYPETRFSDYVLSYFASKHPEYPTPTAESLEKMWRESQHLFSVYKGVFVMQNLYPFGLVAGSFLTFTLGQLLETLIIADRVYYLQRHGASVKVVCAFERKKSPRCMLIQAVKNTSVL